MRASTSIETSRSSYHHGDLRAALLAAARDMIAEAGIEGLSLRKLAERAGVSRTAPYHHFQDKNDLLCAIAAEGFQRRHREAIASFKTKNVKVQRFKGLGEMNAEQLWETAMNPENRVFLQARIEDAAAANEIFEMLMGERVEPRRDFIKAEARKVQNLDV